MSKSKQNAWIGAAIRFVRFERRVTQMELAQALSVPQATISKYEAGSAIIPASFLIEFCKFFEMNLSDMTEIIDKGQAMANLAHNQHTALGGCV